MKLIQKTDFFLRKHGLQFSKFLLVGLINTMIGYGIFYVITLMGAGPSLALLFTYILAVQINYMTTGRFVFSISNFNALVPFIAAYVVIYGFNLILLHSLMKWQNNQLIAQAMLLPFLAPISFFIFKNIVFRKP